MPIWAYTVYGYMAMYRIYHCIYSGIQARIPPVVIHRSALKYHVDHQAIEGHTVFSGSRSTAAYHLPHKYHTSSTTLPPIWRSLAWSPTSRATVTKYYPMS